MRALSSIGGWILLLAAFVVASLFPTLGVFSALSGDCWRVLLFPVPLAAILISLVAVAMIAEGFAGVRALASGLTRLFFRSSASVESAKAETVTIGVLSSCYPISIGLFLVSCFTVMSHFGGGLTEALGAAVTCSLHTLVYGILIAEGVLRPASRLQTNQDR